MTSRDDLTGFGRVGEQWVIEQLRQRGYTVEWIGDNSDYDLLLEGQARAEVKSAFLTSGSRGNKGRWQFSLRRHGLAVDEDLLFLLCFQDLETPPLAVFIIPGRALGPTLSKIDVTSADPTRYRGKWAQYRGDWSQVEGVIERLSVSKPVLFRLEIKQKIPF